MIDVLDHEHAPAVQRGTARVARPVPPPTTSSAGFHRPAHHTAVVVLLPLRLFLAAGWLRASAEKLIDRQWWTGAKLHTFLTAQHDEALPFFRPVMEHAIAPNAQFVAIVVAVTQLLCGVAIAVGKPMRLALRWTFLMNVVFMMTGKVNPSCFYLVMEIVLLFAIADGTIGVRPTTPSWRSVAAAGTSVVLGAACVPYIRTIEPAKVIEDPAMMLTFLGVIMAATWLVRHSAYRPPQARHLRRVWTTWYAGWIHAKPKQLVRNEYERRYTPQGARFAPPQHGTAVYALPPLPTRPSRVTDDDAWVPTNPEVAAQWQ